MLEASKSTTETISENPDRIMLPEDIDVAPEGQPAEWTLRRLLDEKLKHLEAKLNIAQHRANSDINITANNLKAEGKILRVLLEEGKVDINVIGSAENIAPPLMVQGMTNISRYLTSKNVELDSEGYLSVHPQQEIIWKNLRIPLLAMLNIKQQDYENSAFHSMNLGARALSKTPTQYGQNVTQKLQSTPGQNHSNSTMVQPEAIGKQMLSDGIKSQILNLIIAEIQRGNGFMHRDILASSLILTGETNQGFANFDEITEEIWKDAFEVIKQYITGVIPWSFRMDEGAAYANLQNKI